MSAAKLVSFGLLAAAVVSPFRLAFAMDTKLAMQIGGNKAPDWNVPYEMIPPAVLAGGYANKLVLSPRSVASTSKPPIATLAPEKTPRPVITGEWAGEAIDSTGPGSLVWQISESGGKITGTVRAGAGPK